MKNIDKIGWRLLKFFLILCIGALIGYYTKENNISSSKVIKTYHFIEKRYPIIKYNPEKDKFGGVYGERGMNNVEDCLVDDTCPR